MTLPENLSRRAVLMKLGLALQWHHCRGRRRSHSRLCSSPRFFVLERSATQAGSHSAPSINFPPAKRASPPSAIPMFRLGMARPPKAPAGSAASTRKPFKSSPSIVRISAVRSVGSRSPDSSCVPATAASITKTALALPALLNAASSNTPTKLMDSNLLIKAGELPTPGSPSALVNISGKLPCA